MPTILPSLTSHSPVDPDPDLESDGSQWVPQRRGGLDSAG
jgi:hypothetical protein